MRVRFLNHRAIVFGVLLSLLWVAFGASPRAGAQGRRIPKREGHINDFAAVIEGPAKQRLEKVLASVQEKTGVDFVLITVKTSGNEDLYDYSVRVASSLDVGPATRQDSVLLVVAAETANFMTHVSRTARARVPERIIGETGKSLKAQLDNGLGAALIAAVKTFVDQMGASDNFSFASLDSQSGETLTATRGRPRTVESPVTQPSENPQPTPAAVPTPGEASTPRVRHRARRSP